VRRFGKRYPTAGERLRAIRHRMVQLRRRAARGLPGARREHLEGHPGDPGRFATAEEMAEVIKHEYLDVSFLRNVTRFDPTR